jgi:transcriptional regulator with XRE-family HTH domain
VVSLPHERGLTMKLDHKKIDLVLARQSMTRAVLAERCGRTRQWVSWLLDQTDVAPHVVGQLANGLGVPVEAILADDAPAVVERNEEEKGEVA